MKLFWTPYFKYYLICDPRRMKIGVLQSDKISEDPKPHNFANLSSTNSVLLTLKIWHCGHLPFKGLNIHLFFLPGEILLVVISNLFMRHNSKNEKSPSSFNLHIPCLVWGATGTWQLGGEESHRQIKKDKQGSISI